MPAASSYTNPSQEARKKAAVLERVGRYREAAHYWHLALADAPDDVKVLCGLAHVYYQLNECEHAERYIDQALVADPNNERAYRLRCLLVLGHGKKTAIDAALRAVELSPTGRYPLMLLVQAYLAAGETEKAKKAALHLGRLFPSWSTSHLLVAEVAFQLEKYRTAEFYVRSALVLNAESGESHFLLGQILFAMDKRQEAASAFLSALKLQPDSKAARLGLIFCVIALRRFFGVCLYFAAFCIVLTVAVLPGLHFSSWQFFVIPFLLFQSAGLVKLLKSRVALSPDVEAVWRVEKAKSGTWAFLCVRALFGKKYYTRAMV